MTIIVDNDPKCVNKMLTNFYTRNDVNINLVLKNGPQTKEQEKVTNKALIIILKKNLKEQRRNGVNKQPEILWELL